MRVRGTCKAGHTTQTTSDPGRVTWNGVCATEGCELPVKAKRVPGDTPAAPPPETQEPPPDDAEPTVKVVDYGKRAPRQRRAPDKPEPPADEPAGGAVQGAGPLSGATAPAAEPERKPGLRERLRARRGSAGNPPRYEFNPFGY